MHPTIDPWSSWLASGGDQAAFPYGPGMAVISMPAAIAARFFGLSIGSVVLLLTFLIFDVRIFCLLSRRVSTSWLSPLFVWSLGPLAIFGTYVHGQTDVIIGYCVLASMALVQRNRWKSAGALIGFGATVKLSALLLLPFMAVFALRNPRYRSNLTGYFTGVAGIVLAGFVPVLYSPGFRTMVLGSQESKGLLDYSISFGRGEPFLLVPVVYTGMLYFLWRRGRGSIGVANCVAVSAVAMLVLVAPSSIGWYLWFLPAILGILTAPRSTTLLSSVVLQLSVTLLAVFHYREIVSRISGDNFVADLSLQPRITALGHTFVLCIGLVMVSSFLRRGLWSEDPFEIHRSPLSLGIAGDSGTGKDTLTEAVSKAFPPGMCQVLEGDDYHLYERGAPEWDSLTHLNPQANNLALLRRDALRAKSRHVVRARWYDHDLGRFGDSREIKPGDIMVVNGLHSHYIDQDHDVLDLRVFLKMEDDLRAKLKLTRDVQTRSATPEQVLLSLSRRKPDSHRYINPQSDSADIVIDVTAAVDSDGEWGASSCLVTTRDLTFPNHLSKAMKSLTNIRHELRVGTKMGELIMNVDTTEVSVVEIGQLVNDLTPEFSRLFLHEPMFASQTLGFETLIVLLGLAEKRQTNERP